MKKLTMVTIGMSILGGTVLGGFAPEIGAAETASSQANINILGGELSITKAEDIDFGEIKIDGKDHTKDGNDISVTFSDYRGSAAEGFELKVKSDNAFANKGLNIELTPKSINDKQGTIGAKFELTDEFNQLVSADKDAITGEATDYDLLVGTHLSASKKAKAGTYQTILTWDLSATPTE